MGALPFCSTPYSSGERVRPEMRTSSSLLTTGNFFTETVKPESAWTGIENQTTKDVQRPLVTAQDWIQSPRMVQGRCGEVCMPRCIPMFSGQQPTLSWAGASIAQDLEGPRLPGDIFLKACSLLNTKLMFSTAL